MRSFAQGGSKRLRKSGLVNRTGRNDAKNPRQMTLANRPTKQSFERRHRQGGQKRAQISLSKEVMLRACQGGQTAGQLFENLHEGLGTQ